MHTEHKPVIDYTRVADGFLFDTHRLRCQYLGKTTSEKPPWLEEHNGQYQRVEDVLREYAQPPDDMGAARTELTCQTSSPDSRNEGDSLAGCSAPSQPEPVPAPVSENVPSVSRRSELPRSEAAMTETEALKAAATPVGPKRRSRARGTGRRSNKQQPAAKVTNASGKFSPERARVVLDSLSERPIQSDAAEKAGIHRKTLENWIKHSKAGDAGYDIEHEGVTMRFHVHCEWSKEAATDKLRKRAYLIAMGKDYVADENGNLTLETVGPPNLKMMRFALELFRPEVYGKKTPKPDVPQRSGVILVGAPEKPKRTCPAASIKARSWKGLLRKFR
jgi:hypothetical protein